ncbi:MAG: undecaprenyl-diphosphate phosphatase, partial [Alphaproteobacteria bacterium]
LMGFLSPAAEGAKVNRRSAWNILIATIPIVLVGGALFHIIETDLRSILLVAATTIIFGLFLGWTDKHYPIRKSLDEMTAKDALIIGFFQILALLPGTSRSGITMSAARIVGLDRTEAAHFSMLLSIPTILGAGTLAASNLVSAGNVEVGREAVTGAIASGLFALCVISLLMRWIGRIGFTPFVIYRMILGAGLIVLYFAA